MMKKFFLKLFVVCLPVIILLVVYFYNDPFKVLYHYDSYYPKDGIQYVMLNLDYAATENFIDKYPKYKYNSYIFGNSRGVVYNTDEWKKILNDDSCYNFSVYSESLYGIERKIHLIDSLGGAIKNVLMVIDEEVYRSVAENEKFPKDPVLSGKSKIGFQLNNIKGYFDKDFIDQYIYFLVTKKIPSIKYNVTPALTSETVHYDPGTNTLSCIQQDKKIDADTGAYYGNKTSLFYQRDKIQRYSNKIIKNDQILLFNNIKKILSKNRTSYKIVISPLYNQLKMDTTDFKTLCAIFGKENIYDLSGINNITESRYNFYEPRHYRGKVATRIMDSIYAK